MGKKYHVGYTAGVFDLLHEGHINILRNAKEQCDTLIVAVTTDELCKDRKGCFPALNLSDRCQCILDTGYADQIIVQNNMDKYPVCLSYNVDAVFVGDDWKNTPSWNELEIKLKSANISVEYLKRTPNISSSNYRAICKDVLLYYDSVERGYAILKYLGTGETVTIPDFLGIYPVIRIDEQAFAFCHAKIIRCGNSLRRIGNEAFFGCVNLQRVELPDGLCSIGSAAFFDCKSIESIKLPSRINELPSYLFGGCSSLKDISFSNTLLRMCIDVFDIYSPCVQEKNGVYCVHNWVIGCADDAVEIDIPAGCIGVADAAFLGNETLQDVHIPDSVQYIGAFSFDGTKLWNAHYKGGVIYADKWAVGVADPSLAVTCIALQKDTVGIGDMAFACCRGLRSIDGLQYVKIIGRDAFKGCPYLEVNNVNNGN